MNKRKRNLIISGGLFLSAIIFTVLVKNVDMGAIGPNNSIVGLSHINKFIFEITGVNMIWYHITDWMGLVPIVMSFAYAIIGLIQLIKRKSLSKVDREIVALGIFYIVLISLYVGFEMFIVNYRPILMNGYLEASYPSSHTMMAVCICGSAILINKKLFRNNRFAAIMNFISMLIMFVTVIGRLISGVHWISDILGSLIISATLLMFYYVVLNIKMKREKQ